MYQPAHGRFVVADPAAALADLCAVMPASLVTAVGGSFRSTILPLLFDPAPPGDGRLLGHLARGNPHWREIGNGTQALAVFVGPEAYISPSLYEEKRRTGKVVPTWNYVAVQAHGFVTVHHEPDWLHENVRGLVLRHEAGRPEPWSVDDAPADYVESQVRAIVGIEFAITHIEAKRKLSQNRSEADVQGVIQGFAAGSPEQQAVAEEMRREVR
jgi:transcriptional regulator